MGATEAINLCLQAVARPGDVIAETPTFYAMLHAIERMGMKVVEVPTDPELGIDVDMLARLARELPIAARMVMPNFQNPLGFRMPDERKAALVRLATERDMPIIENGGLQRSTATRRPARSAMTAGLVLHSLVLSKTLTSVTASAGLPLPRPGREAEIPEHADHARDSATGHRGIPGARRLRPQAAAHAQGLRTAGPA